MRKGIIFSIDAALALVLVIVLAAAIAAQYSAADGKEQVLSSIAEETQDAAVVGLYLGKSAGDFGLDSSFDAGAGEFVKCTNSYELNPNNGFSEVALGDGFFTEKKFCGVR